jgi:ferredoxin-NADP reductase
MADTVSWRGGDDLLRCTAIATEAPGVKTFRFAPVSGAPVRFHAGQFVTLRLPLDTGEVWRCFTIASSPLQDSAIDLTIKTQGGAHTINTSGTAWMHHALAVGMTLRAMQPAGPFCLTHPPETPLLLVSAGSGATPMASIARFLRDIGCRTPVHYVHLARTQADWLFKPEIEAIAAALGSWKLDFLTTTADGRPTAAAFAAIAPDLARREVFCCGPAGFMAAVEEAHRHAGGPATAFRKEAFIAIPIPELAPAAPSPAASPTTFTLRFEPSGKEAAARGSETVLAVAGRLGLAIPYACAEGICGTCRVRRRSGIVEMNHQGGIEEDEVEAGEILACCSYARSNLVLEIF